jgi:hypothetical protein
LDCEAQVSDFVIDGFGLKYAMKAALEAGAPVVWGARAIWSQGRRPELLGDRQSYHVNPSDIAGDERSRRLSAFMEMINRNSYLAKAWENIPPELSGKDDRHCVLLDNEDVLIEANPMASYGYLYVCASSKPVRI